MNVRKAQTIAVVNRKGGVGKTTVAVHLAAGLAAKGKRVGLVDTDSQGHAGMMLAMADENGLYRALIEKQPVGVIAREVPVEHYQEGENGGALVLLPSSDKTYRIPVELTPGDIFAVQELIEALVIAYELEVVVVDTSPSLTAFDGALWMAVDWFLFVVECERLAVDGLQSALNQMERFGKARARHLGRGSRILGIIPNKLKANTVLQREVIGQLGQAYEGLVWTPVTDRIAWANAAYFQVPVFKSEPGGQAARDAWTFVCRAMEVLNAESI